MGTTDYSRGHLEAHRALDPVSLAELYSQYHVATQPTKGTSVAWELILPHLHKTILWWVARAFLDKEILCKLLSTTTVPLGRILRASFIATAAMSLSV